MKDVNEPSSSSPASDIQSQVGKPTGISPSVFIVSSSIFIAKLYALWTEDYIESPHILYALLLSYEKVCNAVRIRQVLRCIRRLLCERDSLDRTEDFIQVWAISWKWFLHVDRTRGYAKIWLVYRTCAILHLHKKLLCSIKQRFHSLLLENCEIKSA